MDLRIGGTKGEDYSWREEHFTGNSNEIRKRTVTATKLITKVYKRESNSHAKMLTMNPETINNSRCLRHYSALLEVQRDRECGLWSAPDAFSLGPSGQEADLTMLPCGKEAQKQVLLTTEAAIRTKERGWIHASRIKGPVDEPKEWTITSEPGDTKLTLKRGLGGNELGRPKWSKKHTQDHT
ncbi:hypothetical protein DUI87_08014 [Hirundo rustica rustica]|uniref:Uncharacterized protein n=1 Tax=Hirundo rustica rustica TaxID=333673 RepID=A0A3M0KYI6_HIRRU|nr:hypothetical protein DUI87_08014 [Hirundo rustica rustica]